MKKNNKKVEVETKVIEQPKVETVVETPKKKRKHYRKPKVKVQPVVESTTEPISDEYEMNTYSVTIDSPIEESKPTFKEWIQAIRYGWATIPGFWNKIKWTYQLIKLNK